MPSKAMAHDPHRKSSGGSKKVRDRAEKNGRHTKCLMKWKGKNATAGVVAGFSAFRRARKMRRRLMTKEEYVRLKQMVPSIATQTRVSKVQVIEEAIKYIDSLHLALFHRLRAQDPRTGGLTADDNTMDQSQLRQWIGQMLPAEAAQFLAQHLQHREKTNKWPTFLDKVDRMVRKKNS